ncbi:hypothetical protein FSP39_017034 [Pinctada imbricata]|uniref:B box-type domain-containing protein n=1 Tax=Pinctada imbricata TaxID=66713 RepID=A0AA88YX75_PINIB|nr:hypothetical protein FSP39_017034 [Pinctada imbricata]
MASPYVFFCEPCLRGKMKKQIRGVCRECRLFLCKDCSDLHMSDKNTQAHPLFDLCPQNGDNSSSGDQEGSDSPVLYKLRAEDDKNARQGAFHVSTVKAMKLSEFELRAKTDKEMVRIQDMIQVGNRYVVVDIDNRKLILFDQTGKYVSSTSTSFLKSYIYGIANMKGESFVTCGDTNEIHLWAVRGQTIVSEGVTHKLTYKSASGIYFNGTYFCTVHCRFDAFCILDKQGKRVKKFVLKEPLGMTGEFGSVLYMDPKTHNIYSVLEGERPGIMCITVEGNTLWCTPMGIGNGQPFGITEFHGLL